MNKTEQNALKYITEILKKENVKFQSHDSPDFIVLTEQKGYEIKRLYGRCIWMYNAQYERMKAQSLNIDILVFENGHTQPTTAIPLTEITDNKVINGVLVKILPDMPGVKIEEEIKMELTKIAGEVQSKKGGKVSLSEAIDFLIQFYREHKGA